MSEFIRPTLDGDFTLYSDFDESPRKSPSTLEGAKRYMSVERYRMIYRQRKDKNLLPVCKSCFGPLNREHKKCFKCLNPDEFLF